MERIVRSEKKTEKREELEEEEEPETQQGSRVPRAEVSGRPFDHLMCLQTSSKRPAGHCWVCSKHRLGYGLFMYLWSKEAAPVSPQGRL